MYQLPLRKKKVLEKHIGETPLQTIERFKVTHPRYKDIPATYAGRLDPMASGKLLVLFGEECKKKEEYLGLDKQYDIEVLLGVGSDTGDILGMTTASNDVMLPARPLLISILQKEVGTHEQPYPIYSSNTVDGKPLFLYALEGTLESISIPTHEETIYDIRLLDIQTISTSLLETHIKNTLSLAPVSLEPSKELGADFRISEVLNSWDEIFTHTKEYAVLKLRVTCGSGAYMRTLAERIGTNLGTNGLALSIHRRHIGKRNILW
jgi:tRNA pseudouridine(55) synthase